jgi:hypothetical protein
MQMVTILNSISFQLLFHLLITSSCMYSVIPEALFYDEILYKARRCVCVCVCVCGGGGYTVSGRIYISKKYKNLKEKET